MTAPSSPDPRASEARSRRSGGDAERTATRPQGRLKGLAILSRWRWPPPVLSAPRALALLLTSLLLTLASCLGGDTTRISGHVSLSPTQHAGDDAPHRLVIAAFPHGAITPDALASGELRPLPGLYATVVVSNGTFAAPIGFRISAPGGATDADVLAWWKTSASSPGEDGYVPPAASDRMSGTRRVFEGDDGTRGDHAGGVELSLDGRVFLTRGGTLPPPLVVPTASAQ